MDDKPERNGSDQVKNCQSLFLASFASRARTSSVLVEGACAESQGETLQRCNTGRTCSRPKRVLKLYRGPAYDVLILTLQTKYGAMGLLGRNDFPATRARWMDLICIPRMTSRISLGVSEATSTLFFLPERLEI